MASLRFVLLLTVLVLLLSDSAHSKRAYKKKKKADKKPAAAADTTSTVAKTYAGVLNSPEALSLTPRERAHLAKSDPQALFNDASIACQDQEHTKCYIGFMLFQERFPELVEGYSNAGVALERMGRLEDAKTIYRKALEKFPGAEKAVGPLLNVLQLEAVQAYDTKNLKVAYDRYEEIVRLAPQIPDAFINLGNIQEGLQDYDGACASYEAAINVDELSVKAYNAICRLMLMEVSGHGAGRFGVTSAQRMAAFEKAKIYCAKATHIAPKDKTANMNLGMLYKESLEFDLAIHHLNKAREADPNDHVVLTNLATTMSRNDQVAEAVVILEQLILASPTASSLFSLGTVLAPFDRLSKRGLEGHEQGQRKVIKAVKLPTGVTCKHGKNHRKLRLSWLSAKDPKLDIIEMVDEDSTFGIDGGPRTLANVDLADSKIQAIPLDFIDKQTIAVTIKNVYVEGAGAVMYTNCEVFANMGKSTEIPRDYKGTANETIKIDGPVVSLLHPSIGNYYHWTAESATRLLLSMDYYFGENGVAPNARLLFPAKVDSAFPWEFMKTLGIKPEQEPMVYQPASNRRYKFKTLHRIDWVQVDTEDPDQHDLWSDYLPSRHGLFKLRQRIREHQQQRRESGTHTNSDAPKVVYVSRSGVRAVNNENILVNYLEKLLGDKFLMHDGRLHQRFGGAGTTLQTQFDMYESADIILGPHGAGLTNMVFAQDNVSVVEFPMAPQANRCFGYIAATFQIDYWIVPEVTCFYHLKYTMTKKKAIATLKVIRKILKEKGLAHYMEPGFDWMFGKKKSDKKAGKTEL